MNISWKAIANLLPLLIIAGCTAVTSPQVELGGTPEITDTPVSKVTSTGITAVPGRTNERTVDSSIEHTPVALETNRLMPLMINIAPEPLPYFSCLPFSKPGEVLLIEEPDRQARSMMFDGGSYYDPLFSPNGEWIALLSITTGTVVTSTLENGVEWTYPESDQVIVYNSSSMDIVAKSIALPRSNFHNIEGGCESTAGISRLIGWSHDSAWIGFDFLGLEYKNEQSYHVLMNIQTGETVKLPFMDQAVWGSVGNTLVQLNNTLSQLEIFDLERSKVRPIIIPYPSDIPETYWFSDIDFSRNRNKVYLLGQSRQPKSPQTIWSVELDSETWIEELDLDSQMVSDMSIGENYVALCEHGRDSNIELKGLTDWSLKGAVQLPSGNALNCLNLKWQQNNLVAFEYLHPQDIWVLNAAGNPPLFTKAFDRSLIGIPQGFEITSFDWMH